MPQQESRVSLKALTSSLKKGWAFRISREAEAMNSMWKNTVFPISTTLEVHLDGENSWMLMAWLFRLRG